MKNNLIESDRILIAWAFSMSYMILSDFFGVFSRGFGRQLIFVSIVSIAVLLIIKYRSISKDVVFTLPFLLLLLFSFPGLLYSKIFGIEYSLFNAISLNLMVILPFLIPRKIKLPESNSILTTLYIMSCFYCAVTIIIVFADNYIGGIKYIGHERVFLLPLIYLIPAIRKQYTLMLIGVVIAVIIYQIDPRTTTVITMALSLLAFIALSFSKAAHYILIIMAVLIFGGMNFNNIYNILKTTNSSIKESAESGDNSDFRESMWQLGINNFEKSPLVGNYFSEGGIYYIGRDIYGFDGSSTFSQNALPLHNDYLEFLVSGGLFGFTLFILTYVYIIYTILIIKSKSNNKQDVGLAVACGVSIICGMFVFSVNPVLNNPRAGYFVYVLIMIVFIVYRRIMSEERI